MITTTILAFEKNETSALSEICAKKARPPQKSPVFRILRDGIPRWSPGQLRKTRAIQARRDGDLETAQQILGHSSKQTTERHYADVDLSRAEANALQFG